MNKKRYIIVITGATGVGKTDFALQLGKHMPIEIVNADLGQFYQPLTIGTAKPHWQQEPIPHHLFDIGTIPESFTVTEYKKQLLVCLEDIWQRNKIPVIVGGSTFYIESIFFEPVNPDIIKEPDINTLSDSDLWNQLNIIDPERAAQIHPHDVYRLERALTIWHTTGVKPSLQKPLYNPPAPFLFFHITRDRPELYERINQRVITMLDVGWIEEVKKLLATPWEHFIQTKKFIGYPEIIAFLKDKNPLSYQELVDTIAQRTRNYAKRQETYWKRLKNKLHNCLVFAPGYTYSEASKVYEINLTSLDLDVYIKQLSATLCL